MGRPGIRISQEGISVDRAADYQRVLDDRWPFMDAVVDVQMEINKTEWPATEGYWSMELASHDLGYIPAFTCRQENITTPLFPRDVANEIVATKNKVYLRGIFVPGDPTDALRIRCRIRVFAVDITQEFRQEVGQASLGARTSASRYGIRVIDGPGVRLEDTDMTKFRLHNNAKALGIQHTGVRIPDGTNGYSVIVDHDLGYPPTYFFAKYRKPEDWSGSWTDPMPNDDYIYPMNQAPLGLATSNTFRLQLAGAQGFLTGRFAFLIVKDPIEVAA